MRLAFIASPRPFSLAFFFLDACRGENRRRSASQYFGILCSVGMYTLLESLGKKTKVFDSSLEGRRGDLISWNFYTHLCGYRWKSHSIVSVNSARKLAKESKLKFGKNFSNISTTFAAVHGSFSRGCSREIFGIHARLCPPPSLFFTVRALDGHYGGYRG